MSKLRISILCALLAAPLPVRAAAGKILVVVSSQSKITLKGGTEHPTGYFLNELVIPLKALVAAGYEPVFANPLGNEPAMDKNSDTANFFGGNRQTYEEAKSFLASLPSLRKPMRLAELRAKGIGEFAGIFVPGGHAPMEDLLTNKDLGALLREFHAAGKATGLICHGPIALLSALEDPAEFTAALASGKKPARQKWIYRDYKMTSFSTAEEKQEEPGGDNVLGGRVRFYPDAALKAAGGKVAVAGKWQSHAVRDRELITGQNPVSDAEFARLLLRALEERAR